MEGESSEQPQMYVDRARGVMGSFYQHVPAGALEHDPNAYLKSTALQLTH
jgi:hypothetical protein